MWRRPDDKDLASCRYAAFPEALMDPPKVSIVIVNWNGKEYLHNCLTSLFRQTYPEYEVVLVDNGSTDGSGDYVESHFPQTKVIRLERNYGFAGGNNVGIAAALADPAVKYVATLNNDTEVDTRWLEELVGVAEAHERAGSVAPKIMFHHDHNLICCTGICVYKDCDATERGRLEEDRGQYELQEEVFGPTAASALLRREMLEEVGVFDEDYFAYYEDVDLAWRARLAGWKCLYVPSALVYHVLGGTSRRFSTLKAYHMERNRVWNMFKLLPAHMIAASVWYSGIRYCVLIYGIRGGRGAAGSFVRRESAWKMVSSVLRAYIDAFRGLPRILKKRRQIQGMKKVPNSEIARWFKEYGVGVRELVFGRQR